MLIISIASQNKGEIIMHRETERRRNDRYEVFQSDSIEFFPFSSIQTDHVTASVKNSSESGLCIESHRPLKPGQNICIRNNHESKWVKGNNNDGRIREISLAKVQWCDEKKDQVQHYFDIGVQYL
jgi:hypothetical protein